MQASVVKLIATGACFSLGLRLIVLQVRHMKENRLGIWTCYFFEYALMLY